MPDKISVPSPLLVSDPANAIPEAKVTALFPVSSKAVALGEERARRLLRSTATPAPYIRVPPLKKTVPEEPSAEAFPRTSSPELRVVPPA